MGNRAWHNHVRSAETVHEERRFEGGEMYRRVSFGKREASKSECEMFVKPIFWHKLWHHIFVTICGASVLVATLGGKVF